MTTALRTDGLYCAYLRKSRKDAELEALGGGDTLSRHEHALNELAARLGIKISQTYREVVSGDTISERPEAQRLLEAVNSGAWDGVLVMDVDRLGRGDSVDQGIIMQSFLYTNTLIITPDKTYNPMDDSDSEFVEIKLFFARREYNMIKKRMQRGRLSSAMDGCYMGSRPVYGYERYKLPGRKGWSLRIVPEKAEIVRAVFSWYAYGMDGQDVGGAAIATRLNDMGLKTDLGHPFEASYVRHMLQNPVYIGKVQWNQRVTTYHIENGVRTKSRPKSDNALLVDGLHEPIIDMELWNRVQKMFATHEKRPKNKYAKIANPLAGLVRCSVCGRMLSRVPSPNRQGPFLKCTTQKCPTASAYLSVVEDSVLEALSGWVSEFEASDVTPPVADSAEYAASVVAIASLQERREILMNQLNNLYNLLEQGVYSIELYQQRHTAISTELAYIDADIERQKKIPRPDPRINLIPKVKTVLEAYKRTDDAAEKNALLREVIDHIVYFKTRRGYRNNSLSDFLFLEVYPRFPDLDNPF